MPSHMLHATCSSNAGSREASGPRDQALLAAIVAIAMSAAPMDAQAAGGRDPPVATNDPERCALSALDKFAGAHSTPVHCPWNIGSAASRATCRLHADATPICHGVSWGFCHSNIENYTQAEVSVYDLTPTCAAGLGNHHTCPEGGTELPQEGLLHPCGARKTGRPAETPLLAGYIMTAAQEFGAERACVNSKPAQRPSSAYDWRALSGALLAVA